MPPEPRQKHQEESAAPAFVQGWLQRLDRWASVIRGSQPMEADDRIARGPIRFGLYAFILIFGIFGLWSAFAPLDSAAIAPGIVVLDSNRKQIQHLEGGIVDEILVTEGQFVDAGDTLVRLSETAAKARLELVSGQLHAERATAARLVAERDDAGRIDFPPDLLNSTDPELAEIIESQRRLFTVRQDALSSKIGVLSKRIEQFRDEIRGLRSQTTSTEDQLVLIKEEVSVVDSLLKKGNAVKPRLLALQRQQAELEGRRGEYLAMIARAQQSITQTDIEILNIQNEHLKDLVDQLRETQERIAQLQEQRNTAKDVLDRLVVVAPQSGIITGMKIHTQGGVIAPGETVMELVPQDDKLIIEARVSPQDIDVVHQGLEAQVRLTAFKTRKIPPVRGDVIYVSADRFIDPQTNQGYFLSRIEIDEDELMRLQEVELYPGMPADVLIVTGSRTLLSYLIAPITDSFYLAFREQ